MSTNPNPFNLPTQLLNDEPTGTLARTVPRALCNSNFTGTTGVPGARLIPLPAGLKVSNISVHATGTAEVTGSHFWCALCDINMNVLAVTADQTGASYVTANTFLTNPFLAPFIIPQTADYYCVNSISAVTMPTIASGANPQGNLASVAPAMHGTLGVQAAPPAVGANLGALTTVGGTSVNLGFWLS